jgi:hypothetical protein
MYGLGSANESLPGFVTISPSLGNGGPRNYGNAFLPAVHQGTKLTVPLDSKTLPVENLRKISNNTLILPRVQVNIYPLH